MVPVSFTCKGPLSVCWLVVRQHMLLFHPAPLQPSPRAPLHNLLTASAIGSSLSGARRQQSAVRHIRVINTADGGYCLSKGDPSHPSVWALIDSHMNKALTNSYNSYDSVSLKYPLEPEAAPIAPDLLMSAADMGAMAPPAGPPLAVPPLASAAPGLCLPLPPQASAALSYFYTATRANELPPPTAPAPARAGMNPEEFDEDVAAFLEGGVSSKALARRRSTRHGAVGMHQEDAVRGAMKEHGMLGDPDLERFMNGKITAEELQARRAAKVARGEAEFIVEEEEEEGAEGGEANPFAAGSGGFEDNFDPGEAPRPARTAALPHVLARVFARLPRASSPPHRRHPRTANM